MSLEARFHAALKLARLNVSQWAKKSGYSRGHVYGVLAGDRASPELVAKMEEFTRIWLTPLSADSGLSIR